VVVIVGTPLVARTEDGKVAAGGRTVAIAAGATAAGAPVEIVGRIGDDADGDSVALDLARQGIGHAALLRVGGLVNPGAADAITPLPAADIELALRYLPTYRVVVVADPLDDDGLAAVVAAATWADAHLIVIGREGAGPPTANLPPDAATILDAPDDEEEADGGFAILVGAYAAALDRGEEPGAAFADQASRFNPERIA
jgi:hypothetical protein